jgi:predicted RNase H-like HicB family nuclease
MQRAIGVRLKDRGNCSPTRSSRLRIYAKVTIADLKKTHAKCHPPANARVETRPPLRTLHAMIEIIFEVREDEADGGYVATALGHAIATQGETMDELRDMVRDAVQCHFGDGVPGPMPRLIRLHFVRDEVLAT